jgi:hypothetical protein
MKTQWRENKASGPGRNFLAIAEQEGEIVGDCFAGKAETEGGGLWREDSVLCRWWV